MRELDIVFNRFLEQDYARSSTNDRALFEKLIDSSDADVYAWLMGYAPVADRELEPLIRHMRQLLSEQG